MLRFGESGETITLSSVDSVKDNKNGYVNESGELIFPISNSLGHAWSDEYDKGLVKVAIDDEWMSIYGCTGKHKTISRTPILPKVKYIAKSGSSEDCKRGVYSGNRIKIFSNNIFIDDKNNAKLIDYNDGNPVVSNIKISPNNFAIINYNNILCDKKGNYTNDDILVNDGGTWRFMLNDENIDRINWDYYIPCEYFLGGMIYNDDKKGLIYYSEKFGGKLHAKYTDDDEKLRNYLWHFIFTDTSYYLICDIEFSDKTFGLFDIKREDIFLDGYSKIIDPRDSGTVYNYEYILFLRDDNMYVLVPVNDILEAINDGTYVNLSDIKYTEYSDADDKYTKLNEEYFIRVREPYGKWGIIDSHGDMVAEGYNKIGDLGNYENINKIYAERDGKIGYIIFDKYDRAKFIEGEIDK